MDMDGNIIRNNAIKRMAEVTEKALEQSGVPMEDVALFIPHQANLSIIKATAESLNFPMERVMVTVPEYGNTSAAAIPMVLREAWATGRIKRNDIMVIATFGAGLEFAAAVLPMVGLPSYGEVRCGPNILSQGYISGAVLNTKLGEKLLERTRRQQSNAVTIFPFQG